MKTLTAFCLALSAIVPVNASLANSASANEIGQGRSSHLTLNETKQSAGVGPAVEALQFEVRGLVTYPVRGSSVFIHYLAGDLIHPNHTAFVFRATYPDPILPIASPNLVCGDVSLPIASPEIITYESYPEAIDAIQRLGMSDYIDTSNARSIAVASGNANLLLNSERTTGLWLYVSEQYEGFGNCRDLRVVTGNNSVSIPASLHQMVDHR
ncbi:MAG: hypothetical protein ACLFQ7_00260 [Phormidium sp.]|jgi:hypothetical protein